MHLCKRLDVPTYQKYVPNPLPPPLYTLAHTPHALTHTHCTHHTHMHTCTQTIHTPHSSAMMSEEDLLQLHSALTEGLSCVIKFLLVISEKDHPPEELVCCLCLYVLPVLE